MKADFSNKYIVLTGGNAGIGLALAKLLKKAGAHLLIIARKSPQDVSLPADCHYFQCDLSKSESALEIAEHLDDLGWAKIDHLILNAGLGYVGPVASQTPDNIDALINVNLKTPIALANTLFPQLEAAHGSLCFIGSTLANRSTPDFATYTATKTAISDFARNLDTEWKGRVRIQEVDPGPTRTDFHAKSGLHNPAMVSLFMTAQEVAAGIFNALASGRRKTRYRAPSLLIHAAKRALSGRTK